jgi:predicted house-cleaning noncanonical NTP pyrophosphatase (MazG superfamily)
MNGRRSSTDDAGEGQQPAAEPAERRQFTQRMPEDLVEEIDEFAASHGMSRNAAINMLAKTGLDDF